MAAVYEIDGLDVKASDLVKKASMVRIALPCRGARRGVLFFPAPAK